jgi:hypothetical protein
MSGETCEEDSGRSLRSSLQTLDGASTLETYTSRDDIPSHGAQN